MKQPPHEQCHLHQNCHLFLWTTCRPLACPTCPVGIGVVSCIGWRAQNRLFLLVLFSLGQSQKPEFSARPAFQPRKVAPNLLLLFSLDDLGTSLSSLCPTHQAGPCRYSSSNVPQAFHYASSQQFIFPLRLSTKHSTPESPVLPSYGLISPAPLGYCYAFLSLKCL